MELLTSGRQSEPKFSAEQKSNAPVKLFSEKSARFSSVSVDISAGIVEVKLLSLRRRYVRAVNWPIIGLIVPLSSFDANASSVNFVSLKIESGTDPENAFPDIISNSRLCGNQESVPFNPLDSIPPLYIKLSSLRFSGKGANGPVRLFQDKLNV